MFETPNVPMTIGEILENTPYQTLVNSIPPYEEEVDVPEETLESLMDLRADLLLGGESESRLLGAINEQIREMRQEQYGYYGE